MKTVKLSILLTFAITALISTGCCRNRNEIWDDSKTAGRHVWRGCKALGGKHGDSRQVESPDAFNRCEYDEDYQAAFDYVPLEDADNPNQMAMNTLPAQSPGDPGSKIPGIEAFRDPAVDPKLAGVFQNVHFPYNSSLVKGNDNMKVVRNIAGYLKNNQNTYIFIEGHCDERGPEAYNLALGSRRSNAVRNLLIREGVKPDQIFTISYGKERPLVLGHDEGAWTQNRRGEFKVYQR